jgi:cell volume regulation protein A
MADVWLTLLAGAGLVLVGFIAAQIFDRFRFPDYFILMSIGLVLGSGLLPLPFNPRDSLATIAPYLTNIALAFILFEGGMVLHVRGMKKAWGLVAVHTAVAMALSLGGVWYVGTTFLGLASTTALIMGLAFIGPSASIDMSLLAQLRVTNKTRFTIVVEGVLGNVVAAVLVLLLIPFALNPGATTDTSLWTPYLIQVGGAVLVAYLAGRAWVLLVSGDRPRRFVFMSSVALAVVLYAVGEGFFGGNGGIAAFVFGLVLGHHHALSSQKSVPEGASSSRGLQEFHTELVFLLRTFFFLYLGLRVQLDGITLAAIFGALAFTAVFYGSRWPSSAVLSRAWTLPARDRRILRGTVARGMTDTVLILFAIEVGVIPPGEAALVTSLLFLVILVAAMVSAVLVFRAERLARLEEDRVRVAAPAARAEPAATAASTKEFDRALTDFLQDPIVKQGEID